jgi:hypothetical protein
MPRRPTGQIRELTLRNGVVSYSVRFRGHGYPHQRIPLGRSDEGMNRARASHTPPSPPHLTMREQAKAAERYSLIAVKGCGA